MGTTSGVRLVVGAWDETPLGVFADVMVQTAGGHRVLLAPSEDVASFVAGTYSFDEVRIEPVVASAGARWSVSSPSLDLWFAIGGRRWLSGPLALVPPAVRDRAWFARLCDPVARRLVPGVRTYGTAGGDRTEWYAARSVRHVTEAGGRFDGVDLGSLAPLEPPVGFGFSSAPAAPSLTALRSHVRPAPTLKG